MSAEKKLLTTFGVGLVIICWSGGPADGVSSYSGCLEKDAPPNTMRCYNWTMCGNNTFEDMIYDNFTLLTNTSCLNDTTECYFTPSVFLDTFVDYAGADFINQPGYLDYGYADQYMCAWTLTPTSPYNALLFLLQDKDFDAVDPANGKDCNIKDHLEIKYQETNYDTYCGNNLANDCYLYNCYPPFGIISGFGNKKPDIKLTFRSDEYSYGAAKGFFAVVINMQINVQKRELPTQSDAYDIPIAELYGRDYAAICRETQSERLSDQKYKELRPTITTATLEEEFRSRMSCRCFGNCTISSRDAARLRSTIQDIITDRTSRVAYAYVNSDSVILYHVARRALTNLKVYGTTLPTVCQKCARQRRIYDQCVTNMRSCKATKLLREIEECADWSETCIRRGCGEPPLCDFCD